MYNLLSMIEFRKGDRMEGEKAGGLESRFSFENFIRKYEQLIWK